MPAGAPISFYQDAGTKNAFDKNTRLRRETFGRGSGGGEKKRGSQRNGVHVSGNASCMPIVGRISLGT